MISIIGTGYVGLTTAVCFASMNFDVICVDIDEEKIEKIKKREIPFYEPELSDLLEKSSQKLEFTTDTNYAIENSEISFICVGTPSKADGSIDLRYVESSSFEIGKALKKNHIVVVKSTVIPGTTDRIVKPVLERASGKKFGEDFGIVVNPEFLREGNAVYDFFNPDRIVIGSLDDTSRIEISKLYESFDCPKLYTDFRTAEMIKYASNAFLATKISFINEIANMCEIFKIDVDKVAEGIGLDHRISPHFLKAGPGFGGSCFPKDVHAIISESKKAGYEPILLESVLEVNRRQPLYVVEKVKNILSGLNERKITVLGLSFKPNTDDMRNSPAIPIINELKKNGARVIVYDPRAIENAKKIFGDSIEYAEDLKSSLRGSDCCVIVTDWEEFKEVKKHIKSMNNPILIDTRRILEKTDDILYMGLGRGNNSI
ncbi:MAG: UDP-glucose dehydrogenase family protein [Candidatus Hydrothermarchaeota archaeon]